MVGVAGFVPVTFKGGHCTKVRKSFCALSQLSHRTLLRGTAAAAMLATTTTPLASLAVPIPALTAQPLFWHDGPLHSIHPRSRPWLKGVFGGALTVHWFRYSSGLDPSSLDRDAT